MGQMNGDSHVNNDGGDGCGGIIFIGIIVLAVASMFESAFERFKSKPRTQPISREQTPAPSRTHYLGMIGPKLDWSKLLAHKPGNERTSITVENQSQGEYEFYTFRRQGNQAPGPMFRQAVVPRGRKVQIDCNVGQVFAVVDGKSAQLIGFVTAETQAGVLPFW